MFKVIKTADILLLLMLIALGLGLTFASHSEELNGDIAVVSLYGEEYGIYDLNEDQTITIERGSHVNKIIIKDGFVQMVESTCKNQVCVNQGSISKGYESIVCLPNRIVIEIISEEEAYDGISR